MERVSADKGFVLLQFFSLIPSESIVPHTHTRFSTDTAAQNGVLDKQHTDQEFTR